MKQSEILYAAADYIRTHGWLRGEAGDHGGPRCISGAIWSVTRDDVPWLLPTLLSVTGDNPARFNDKHCKTADDAIAALEIAADIAAAEGK